MLWIGIFVFIAVTSVLAAAVIGTTQRAQAARLRGLAPQAAGGAPVAAWQEFAVRVARPLARLSTPEGDWQDAPVRLRMIRAGWRGASAPLLFYAFKTLLPLLVVVLVPWQLHLAADWAGVTDLLMLLAAALVACYLPDMVVSWRTKKRLRALMHGFPDAADLLLVCMEAGLGLDAAIAKVSEEMRGDSPVAQELHLTQLEIRAGATRESALRNLALRTGLPETATFAALIVQADRFGTGVADALRVFSDDLRHKRHVRAEEAAAKVATKMLLPLVTCIFPAVIVVVLGPAVIQIYRTIVPMLQGGG